MKTIDVPETIRSGELAVIASVSGGKDSTALILALREAEVPCRYVFADTGWEAQETLDYLDTLRRLLTIRIDVVARPGGMVKMAEERAGFPQRMGRWCTEKLKIEPLRAYFDYAEACGHTTVSAVGIRAEESAKRAAMPVFENSEDWGGYVWRPLLAWPVADILAIHHRHGVPVNPLYLRGHDRVGCYPCIFANKGEIALIAEHAPWRVDQIDAMEQAADIQRAERNEETPGRYQHMRATYFQTMRDGLYGIRDVVDWAQTAHGGRHRYLPMLRPPPTGGCMRWGLCEAPPKEGEDAA